MKKTGMRIIVMALIVGMTFGVGGCKSRGTKAESSTEMTKASEISDSEKEMQKETQAAATDQSVTEESASETQKVSTKSEDKANTVKKGSNSEGTKQTSEKNSKSTTVTTKDGEVIVVPEQDDQTTETETEHFNSYRDSGNKDSQSQNSPSKDNQNKDSGKKNNSNKETQVQQPADETKQQEKTENGVELPMVPAEE